VYVFSPALLFPLPPIFLYHVYPTSLSAPAWQSRSRFLACLYCLDGETSRLLMWS